MTILSPMGKFAAVTIVAHNYLPRLNYLGCLERSVHHHDTEGVLRMILEE